MVGKLSKWKRYLPIIGILLFVYILLKVDLSNIVLEIKNTNLYFLFLAVIMVFFMMISETTKWYSIARAQEIKIPFKEALKINMIDNYYGFITPSKVGAVIRAEYLKKYTGEHFGKGFFNFVIDKIMDLSSILFIAIIFSYNFKNKLNLPISFFVVLFILFISSTIFFIKKERGKIVLRIFHRKLIPEKFRSQAKSNFDSFYDHVPKKDISYYFLY